MKCDVCKNNESYVKDYEHNYSYKGKEIIFTSKRRFCKNCNSLIYDSELDNIASKKSIEIYNKLYGIPSEKIVELRKNYNLSLSLFAKIIGCAKKTLISYEKGTSIPNDNYSIILNSLISQPEMLITLIETNKINFSDQEYENIKKKLKPFYDNNIKQLVLKEEFIPTEYNGYTPLNKNKLKNIILFIAQQGILKTNFLKELFYNDFLCYKNTGASITGLEYAKLPYGPVPDDFEKIIETFAKEEIISCELKYSKNSNEYYVIKSLQKFDETIFKPEEVEIIKKVKNYFKDFDSKEIMEFSHEEKAYKETKLYEKIPYDYAFDLKIE